MALRTTEQPSSEAAAYLFHHVVLPPEIPQADDYDPSYEKTLLKMTIQALHDLQAIVTAEEASMVVSTIATVERMLQSRDSHGNVTESQLEGLLKGLTMETADEIMVLEVKAQNAAIIGYRSDDDIVFGFLELAPANEMVVQTKGRLVRTFPGSASSIPISQMLEEGLQKSLSHAIAMMTTQAAPGSQPRVWKQNKEHEEIRDTVHPGIVTDYLQNVIAAMGKKVDTVRVTKNTREEVCWNNCYQPWRRSPLWLLIRVSLHLTFLRKGKSTRSSENVYKAFVVLMLSNILELLKRSWQHHRTDKLHVISAKLLRRLRKMEYLGQFEGLQSGWMEQVKAKITRAHDITNREWKAVVENTKQNLNTSTLHKMQFERDLNMELPLLDDFLSEIATRKDLSACPDFQPASIYLSLSPEELPDDLLFSSTNKTDGLLALESWVKDHLQNWVQSHFRERHLCGKLRRLIERYHSTASAIYAGVPISMSIMYLTVLELWVACDTSACYLYPLLSRYGPELNLVELQCLTLPLRSQMERLHVVERYVQSRHDSAFEDNPSIFLQFGHDESFAVKYFDQSSDLKYLLSNIERDAYEKRLQKELELANLKRKYTNLMFLYNNSECDTIQVVVDWFYRHTTPQHSADCSRCELKYQADALDIDIYEWPVSPNLSFAKATVFELGIPEAFSEWRDVSAYVMADVLGAYDELAIQPQNLHTLDMHHQLSHRLSSSYQHRRIVPLSSVKSHTRTHRRLRKAIPNLENDDVCLENALHYEYYDKSLGAWTSESSLSEAVPKCCMYHLPPRSGNLQRYLYKPPSTSDGVEPNEVIASVSDCPLHFSLDEFKVFGTLPFGRNIVYLNILRQLAVPTLDFTKVETQCLIAQIVHQTGPANGLCERTNHCILTEAVFCHGMLDQLEAFLQRLEENWESWRALAAFSQLARRILSLASSEEVCQRSLDYLNDLGRVCMNWINRLQDRAASSIKDNQRSELNSRAAEIALLGTSTFDVEERFFEDVLGCPSAISTLLRCSIVVQENSDSIESEFQDYLDVMVQAWKSLLYRLLPTLRDIILRDSTGLNQAVQESWAAFSSGPEVIWDKLESSQGRWLHTKSNTLPVHFDLLTGELLVNGLPLAQLPSIYTEHPMYRPLFQRSALGVVPTDEPGMSFSAKSTYRDYELHFGMKEKDMLVVAVKHGKR